MTTEPPVDPAFEALLEYLRQNRGFDFSGYKRASLLRRVTKRMHEVGVLGLSEYMDHLEVHPDEFTQLFNTILINVTSFFRDSEAWQYLAEEVLPGLLAEKRSEDPIRIWSAGCASGEEAYSVAMLLAEALGLSGFRRRVKIYATDVDEEALEQARRATYSAKDLQTVSAERVERFFETSGDGFTFRPELRRSVIFGRHDLTSDAPMSRLDLIVCRNVLMYLNAQTQAGVIGRFHFALNPSGRLFLGRAELLLSHGDLFAPVELKHHIFSKVPADTRREKLLVLAQTGNPLAEDRLVDELQLRAGACDAVPCAQLVLDSSGLLVLANRRAREFFDLIEADLRRPIQDLEISYRPLELRSLIDRAHREEQTIRVAGVERVTGNETRHFDVEVTPLRGNGAELLGTSISFSDSTPQHPLRAELRVASAKLEQTTQAFHSANEELETTNEELQSTNEELETTNEELQSSNEELETMNEELHSTNEELRTMNDVLHEQSIALGEANAFLESVLTGMRAACVVVGPDMKVRVWKEKVEDLWGLRADEVEGQSLMSLEIGLPVVELEETIRACLRGEAQVPSKMIEAVNRRGQPIQCLVNTTPLCDSEGAVRGAILLMEPRAPGASSSPSRSPS